MSLRTFYLIYLNKYSDKVCHRDIELQAFDGKKPLYKSYITFTEAKLNRIHHLYNDRDILKESNLHRSILPNELLIETDYPKPEDNLKITKKIIDVLHDNNIPYWLFFSGGKSFHISVFLETTKPITGELSQKLDELKFNWYMFREWLVKKIFKDNNIPADKLDLLNLKTKRTLIRSCGSIHPKTGFCKVFLDEPEILRVKPEELSQEHFPEEINEWKFKDWYSYLLQYQSFLVHKNEKETLFGWINKPIKLSKNIKNRKLACIEYFLTNRLFDGRKRALFILINKFKFKYSKDELKAKLIDWNENVQNRHLSRTYITTQINYLFKTKYNVGCRYTRELLRELNLLFLCDKCRGYK